MSVGKKLSTCQKEGKLKDKGEREGMLVGYKPR